MPRFVLMPPGRNGAALYPVLGFCGRVKSGQGQLGALFGFDGASPRVTQARVNSAPKRSISDE